MATSKLKEKFQPQQKVSWECKHTGDMLSGMILYLHENSAVIQVTEPAVNHITLERYNLKNDRTVVKYKRLIV